MSNRGVPFSKIKADLLKDPEFSDEYNKLKPRYDIIAAIIEERIKQKITQEELALRIGTQKSNISRFESGNYNPSVDFLVKIAEGLGKRINISLG